MKNVITSIIVVAIVVAGGYYFFNSKTSGVKEDLGVKVTMDAYSTTTDSGANTVVSTNSGQVSSPEPVVSTPKPISTDKKSNMITIETNYGKIVFETYNSDAPNTVKNFVDLASKGFYNGLIFHRVIKGFMIQGGDPNGNGTGGPGYKFADELNPATASYKAGYKKGVVAMANSGPNTNGSQFFIMTADYPLGNNYTIFGKVVSGQDVVDIIANLPTGANDKPVSPVTMKTVIAE
ncbi:MAG: peptidylprolyl isomerase [Minisyncoccia bacterium]